MNGDPRGAGQEETLAWLDKEKKRERGLRKIGYAAWTVTFAALLVYAVDVGANTLFVLERIGDPGAFPAAQLISIVLDALKPLLTVVGVTAILIAVLSTIGTFVRQRAASMAEIQLRLAALERILSAGEGGRGE